jgi:endonuclease-3
MIVLGLRAKDSVVCEVRKELFDLPVPLSPKTLELISKEELFEKLSNIIKPLGMVSSRIKSVFSIIEFFDQNGRAPETFGELSAIMGCGPKVSSLFLDVVYGTPSVCIDTHCHRVLNRIGYTGDPKSIQLDLMTEIDKDDWSKVNPTFIDFGKKVCRALKPFCDICILDCKITSRIF